MAEKPVEAMGPLGQLSQFLPGRLELPLDEEGVSNHKAVLIHHFLKSCPVNFQEFGILAPDIVEHSQSVGVEMELGLLGFPWAGMFTPAV